MLFIVVGQCGNQIGCRFWDLALREHASVNKVCIRVTVYCDTLWCVHDVMCLQSGLYDEAMSSFFRNVDSRYDDPVDIPVGDSRGKIRSLKARVGR